MCVSCVGLLEGSTETSDDVASAEDKRERDLR